MVSHDFKNGVIHGLRLVGAFETKICNAVAFTCKNQLQCVVRRLLSTTDTSGIVATKTTSGLAIGVEPGFVKLASRLDRTKSLGDFEIDSIKSIRPEFKVWVVAVLGKDPVVLPKSQK